MHCYKKKVAKKLPFVLRVGADLEINFLVFGIQFMSEILPRLHFRRFHRVVCGLSRFSVP